MIRYGLKKSLRKKQKKKGSLPFIEIAGGSRWFQRTSRWVQIWIFKVIAFENSLRSEKLDDVKKITSMNSIKT